MQQNETRRCVIFEKFVFFVHQFICSQKRATNEIKICITNVRKCVFDEYVSLILIHTHYQHFKYAFLLINSEWNNNFVTFMADLMDQLFLRCQSSNTQLDLKWWLIDKAFKFIIFTFIWWRLKCGVCGSSHLFLSHLTRYSNNNSKVIITFATRPKPTHTHTHNKLVKRQMPKITQWKTSKLLLFKNKFPHLISN